MIEITCRCGKSKKTFKHNIGPYYVDECCLAEGYDELGKKQSVTVVTDTELRDGETIEDAEKRVVNEIFDLAANLQDDTSPEPQEQDNSETEKEAKKKAKEEEKARKKAEKEEAKARAKAEKEAKENK